MEAPTREEVAAVLREVVTGQRTRQSASEWASVWLLGDVRVNDPVIWDSLQLLGAADLPSTDRPFLYDELDFQASLERLETKGKTGCPGPASLDSRNGGEQTPHHGGGKDETRYPKMTSSQNNSTEKGSEEIR